MEGAARQVTGSVYERDPRARLACLNHHGLYCFVCGFDFSESYGELGKGFIHVHHLRPLSEIRSEYEVNPITDLIPVCPNCHAMLHRRSPPLQPESLRKHLKVMGRVRKGMTRNPNSVKPPKRKSSGEAVGDATGSLPDYYATLPPDRVPKAVGAARAWLNEGVNNPDLLAAEIDRLTPKARRFSDAFWSEFCKVDATFERKVDWHQVYQRLDVGSPATH